MLEIRCKMCNTELKSSPKRQTCGCPNQMTIEGDKIVAKDLSQVIMVNHHKEEHSGVLTYEDLLYQEQRRRRKVRRLDFETR